MGGGGELRGAGDRGLVCYSSDSCTIIIYLPAGYHDNHIVIRWFWAAVERFNNEQRLRLLQVRHVGDRMHTGCPRVDAGGPAGTAESCLRLQKNVHFKVCLLCDWIIQVDCLLSLKL